MKILLLQPPIQDFYDTDIRLQPIGLCYLKAAIQKYLPGFEVLIKDYHHGWGRHTVPVPSELSYLRNYYGVHDKSPFSTFDQYFHFGASFDQIGDEVAAESPDLVGISCLFSPYYREALRCAAEIKKRIAIPIMAGGSHVSAMPEQILKNPNIDFVIRGEGERPLVEFLKSWNNGRHFEKVPNLGFKRRGELVLTSLEENYPLEDLPMPDLSNALPEHYLYEKKPMSFVITSRSCPHRCSFCSVHKTFGFNFRRRSTQNVLAEIQSRYDSGYRVFDFEDDNLTFYKDAMKEMCRELVRMFPKKNVQFVAMNGISYLSLDAELLALMKEAGFTHLNIALVSSDITVRETTKRPHTIPKYLEVIEEASRLGLKTVSYQILGLPNETLDSMIQTLVFNARLPVLLGASMFYLTPNSPIAKSFPEATDEDVFKSRLTAIAIETDHFKREDIYTLFVTTRILNFLKGLVFEEVALDFDEALEKAAAGDQRSKMGVTILRRLFEEKVLYASTAKGFTPLKKFRQELFFKVWDQLEWIGTQQGRRIRLVTRRHATSHKYIFAGDL